MFLTSTLQKLQVQLAGAKATLDCPITIDFVDISGGILVPDEQITNTNGVTATDILSAPPALYQRKVNGLSLNNIDTAPITATIIYNDNGTSHELLTVTLSIGDILGYTDAGGWYTQDTYGSRKTTVQLAYSVVIAALGFTPEDVANKSNDETMSGDSTTNYPTEHAVKVYVDTVAGGTSLDFFLSDTVSDIGTYNTLLNNPSGDPESSISTVITANPTSIKKFATLSTEPAITTLVAGVYTFHIHAAQTAGTKTSKVYANLYTRTSGGTETLRSTSEQSTVLTALNTDYDLHFAISADIPINLTDRIVLEVLGIPIGAGTDPTVVIYMEGTNASRLEFRTTSTGNDNRYLVKGGLSGGQIAIGGLDAGDDLLFQSTSNATKGTVAIGSLTTGLIYDEVTNQLGLGVAPTHKAHILLPADDNVFIDGRTNSRTITLGCVRIEHTAGIDGTKPLAFDIDCAGFANTHAIDTNWIATGIAAGDHSHIYDVHVGTANSTGGSVVGLSVSKSGVGSITATAVETYHGVNVLSQRVGNLTTIEQAWKFDGVYTDTTTAFGSAGTNVQIFVSDTDYIYVGMAATFDDIEVILAIVASGAGIKPVFQYSAGGGSWTTFSPTDGTNGFRQNGNIAWTLPLTGWAVDTVNGVGAKYWVRIQRTQTSLATPPTEDTIKVYSSVLYGWDNGALVKAKALQTSIVNADTLLLQAYDVDGAAYTTFATLTAGNTPTMDLADSVTQGGGTLAKLVLNGAISNPSNYAVNFGSGALTAGTGTFSGAIAASTTVKTGGYTVATLPAGTVGERAYVTDATAPTWNAALTGGGAVVVPVFRNATVWVSA